MAALTVAGAPIAEQDRHLPEDGAGLERQGLGIALERRRQPDRMPGAQRDKGLLDRGGEANAPPRRFRRRWR